MITLNDLKRLRSLIDFAIDAHENNRLVEMKPSDSHCAYRGVDMMLGDFIIMNTITEEGYRLNPAWWNAGLTVGEEVYKPVHVGPPPVKYWCNVHGRQATYADINGRRMCDPKLGGIMLPCSVEEYDES